MICKTPFSVQACPECCGSRETRSWLVFHRECSYCLGAGVVAVCSNRALHPVRIFGHRMIPLPTADQPIDPALIREDERQEKIRAGAAYDMRNRNLPLAFRR
jgi:hypothetical protein